MFFALNRAIAWFVKLDSRDPDANQSQIACPISRRILRLTDNSARTIGTERSWSAWKVQSTGSKRKSIHSPLTDPAMDARNGALEMNHSRSRRRRREHQQPDAN